MKKIGIVLMLVGIMIVGWYGYQHWSGTQSVTKLDDNVVKESVRDQSSAMKTDSIHADDIRADLLESLNPETAAPIDYHDGDEIATLVMPSIDLAFDVFWGTGSDALDKGVGMYDSQWTTPPDFGGHTVLSGHRDSVFRPVGDLEDGDLIYVRYQDEDFEYKINKTWITDAADRSVIVEKDDPTLTLSTCYPFHFIGNAPDRYIVEAELVQKGDLLNLH